MASHDATNQRRTVFQHLLLDRWRSLSPLFVDGAFDLLTMVIAGPFGSPAALPTRLRRSAKALQRAHDQLVHKNQAARYFLVVGPNRAGRMPFGPLTLAGSISGPSPSR